LRPPWSSAAHPLAAALEDVRDALRSDLGLLVCPDADDLPARGSQTLVGVIVARHVGLDLRAPELGVLLGPRRVCRAAVPEAAVDKDGDAELA